MPDESSLLISQAAKVACELSADQTEALAYEIATYSTPKRIRQVAGLAAPRSVDALSEVWLRNPEVDSTRLADALRCAAQAVKTVSNYEKVELIYTGPDSSVHRLTLQALLEVVREAHNELWVVSYLMGPGMDPVLDALRERTDAGVSVNMLLDHRHSSYHTTRARIEGNAPDASVFIWPDEKRIIEGGRLAYLHAKCAVADGRRALVGSANLANYGMEYNLEVGCLVTGGSTPLSLQRHFDTLLKDGELTPA